MKALVIGPKNEKDKENYPGWSPYMTEFIGHVIEITTSDKAHHRPGVFLQKEERSRRWVWRSNWLKILEEK